MTEETHGMTNAVEDAKKNKVPTPIKETPEQTIARLQKENADLQFIAKSQPTISPADSKYMEDIAFLNKEKTGSSGNKITLKDVTDHKNISLWTAWGKRIGPMHPNNALYTYHKFRRLGRVLYTKKPSEDEIQAYYKTPEYIAWKKTHDVDRAKKEESRSGKGLNKVIDAMVKMTGQNRADIISIIDKPASKGIQK